MIRAHTYIKQWFAFRRLARSVAKLRKAEEHYMKRRMAAKVGWEKRRGVA